MKKSFIYALVAGMMILNGCDYHPYYDGQEMCAYYEHTRMLLKEDGKHIYMTLQYEGESPFVMEIYGGQGKNHTITVSDPDCLGYSYAPSEVKTPPFDYDLNAAEITFLPKKLGETSITVTDEDTGESIQFYVHIANAHCAVQVAYYISKDNSEGAYDNKTIFAFKYGGVDDVLNIYSGFLYSTELEHVVSGKYAFVEIDGLLYLEMTYPADETGRPASDGIETFRRYQVQFDGGGSADAGSMLGYMNLLDFKVQTKEVVMPDGMENFRFVDVTGIEESELEMFDPYFYPDDPYAQAGILFDHFYAYSARYVALNL